MCLLFLFLVQTPVFSLGISPPIVELKYIPGKTEAISFSVSSSKAMYYNVTVRGDKEGLFTIPTEPGLIKGSDSFSVSFTQPLYEKPGKKQYQVCATQLPEKSYGKRQISALVSVCGTILLFVPYPEKYLDLNFLTENVNHGETAYFLVSAVSRGTDYIKTITGHIQIYDAEQNSLVAVVPLTPISGLETDERGEMYAEWSTLDAKPGKYKAIANIKFDEESETVTKEFRVGTLDIVLNNYSTQITGGGIRQFNVSVSSLWNEKINDVYAKVFVYDNSSRIITEFQTISTVINEPFGTVRLSGYLDASKLEPGEYPINIQVFFEGKFNGGRGTIIITKNHNKLNLIVGSSVVLLSLLIILFGAVLIARKEFRTFVKKKHKELKTRVKKKIKRSHSKS